MQPQEVNSRTATGTAPAIPGLAATLITNHADPWPRCVCSIHATLWPLENGRILASIHSNGHGTRGDSAPRSVEHCGHVACDRTAGTTAVTGIIWSDSAVVLFALHSISAFNTSSLSTTRYFREKEILPSESMRLCSGSLRI